MAAATLGQCLPDRLEGPSVCPEQFGAALGIGDGAELQDDREMIRQFAVEVDDETRIAVELFDRGQ